MTQLGIVDTIAVAKFDVTDQQVEDLLKVKRVAHDADFRINSAYFNILDRRVNDELKKRKGLDVRGRLRILDEQSAALMKVVNRALITPDIAPNGKDSPEEKARKTTLRQSRVKFAHTAKSEIKFAIEAKHYRKCSGNGRTAFIRANQEVRDKRTDRARARALGPNARYNKFILALNKAEMLFDTLDKAHVKMAALRVDRFNKRVLKGDS